MKKGVYQQPQIECSNLTLCHILAGSDPAINVDTGSGPPITNGGGGDPSNFADDALWDDEPTDSLPNYHLWD